MGLNKRLVSSCCGKKMEIGFQVQDMTPIVVMTENPISVPLHPPLQPYHPLPLNKFSPLTKLEEK